MPTAQRLRILYAAGPGDVAATFRHWQSGAPDPRELSETYSGQFFDLSRRLGATALVVSVNPRRARIEADGFIIEQGPGFLGGRPGLFYHLDQVFLGLRILRRALTFRANIVVISDFPYWFLLSPLLLFGARVIPSLHCTPWPKFLPLRFVGRCRRRLNRFFFTSVVDSILHVSDDVADQVRQMTENRSRPLVRFRPRFSEGLLRELPAPSSGTRPFRVLYAGRVEREKGVFDILSAANALAKVKHEDVVFDICGAGGAMEELVSEAHRSGLDGRVVVHGHCDRKTLLSHMARAHAVIAPTRRDFPEGYNKSVVEGTLAGRPVIASSVCAAVRDVASAAIEVPPDDVGACTDAVFRLAEDPDLYEKKRRAALTLRESLTNADETWGFVLERIIAAETEDEGVFRARAIQGSFWTVAGYGGAQFMRLLGNLALTRLLFPEAFGIMAIVNVFNIGLTMFSDVGLGPNIVRHDRGEEPRFFNTAWTLQILRGAALWLAAVLLALPIAHFYGEPRLALMLPVAATSLFIAGFESTGRFLLQRQVLTKRFVLWNLSSQTAGVVITVLLALWWPSLWALVLGGVLGTLVRAITSHGLVPGHRNRFGWDSHAARSLFSFGKWIFLSSMLFFVSTQADRLILGKLAGMKWLGVYTIAYTLAGIPRDIINALCSNILFPLFSRFGSLSDEALVEKVRRARRVALLVFAVVIALLSGLGDLLIVALYDPRYAKAASILPVLALGLWPAVLALTLGPVLLARGLPRFTAENNLYQLAVVCLGIPLGYHLAGIPGIVVTVALLDVPSYLVVTRSTRRLRLSLTGQDWRGTLCFLFALGAVLGLRYALGWGSPFHSLPPAP